MTMQRTRVSRKRFAEEAAPNRFRGYSNATWGVIAVLLSMCIGCAQDNSPEGLLRQQITQMNKMATAIESGDDPEPFKLRLDELTKQFEELDLQDEVRMELYDRHREEYNKASGRMMAAVMTGMMNQVGDAATTAFSTDPPGADASN